MKFIRKISGQSFRSCEKVSAVISFCFLIFGCSGKSAEKSPEILISDRHSASYERVFQVAKDYAEKHLSEKTDEFGKTGLYRKKNDVLPTLVMLDYHHDVLPDQNYQTDREEGFVQTEERRVTSASWAGMLLEQRLIGKIIWVSGRDLLLPNRNARKNWFSRSTKNGLPSVVEYEKNKVQLMDYHDLVKAEFSEPLIITLDFDVFTRNPGPSPDEFCRELAEWIQKQDSLCFTLCLSAVYQDDPKDLWRWLKIFLDEYKTPADFKLCSGTYGEKNETNDDYVGWMRWNDEQEKFKNGYECFWPGPYLWLNAPSYIQKRLLELGVSADESNGAEHFEASKNVIEWWKAEEKSGWKQNICNRLKSGLKDESGLQNGQPEEDHSVSKNVGLEEFDNVWQTGSSLCSMAFTKLKAVLLENDENFADDDSVGREQNKSRFQNFQQPPQICESTAPESIGIAVRFRTKNTDRGCLSLYGGVNPHELEQNIAYCAKEAANDPRYEKIKSRELPELFANVSIFGQWERMSGAMDFIPGAESVIIDINGERTLLQAAIAMERNYTRDQFLTRLSLKAKNGPNGWQNPNCIFYKAKTISFFGKE